MSATPILLRYWFTQKVNLIYVGITCFFSLFLIATLTFESATFGPEITFTTVMGFLMGAMALLVLGSLIRVLPLISEDRRTNANLFYFSRELHWQEYLRAKLALAYGLHVPALVLLLIGFNILVPSQALAFDLDDEREFFGNNSQQVERFLAGIEEQAINTPSEIAAALLVGNLFLVLAFAVIPAVLLAASTLGRSLIIPILVVAGFLALNVLVIVIEMETLQGGQSLKVTFAPLFSPIFILEQLERAASGRLDVGDLLKNMIMPVLLLAGCHTLIPHQIRKMELTP